MTTDLDRLIEAVEVEVGISLSSYTVTQALCQPIGSPILGQIEAAYLGSLDAAVALLEALLPGWEWGRMNDRMFVEQGGSVFSARGPNPARSLLLATLRAYRSMRKGG